MSSAKDKQNFLEFLIAPPVYPLLRARLIWRDVGGRIWDVADVAQRFKYNRMN